MRYIPDLLTEAEIRNLNLVGTPQTTVLHYLRDGLSQSVYVGTGLFCMNS